MAISHSLSPNRDEKKNTRIFTDFIPERAVAESLPKAGKIWRRSSASRRTETFTKKSNVFIWPLTWTSWDCTDVQTPPHKPKTSLCTYPQLHFENSWRKKNKRQCFLIYCAVLLLWSCLFSDVYDRVLFVSFCFAPCSSKDVEDFLVSLRDCGA